ncbi:tRNA (guanine-N(7)-)-methyltransferase [Serratia symbiotica]|nr:tRNA (guanine-N(7)-)-methyltransferase [Serratia symbiotica]
MITDVISTKYNQNAHAVLRIRSFVRRQGRLTKGQQQALHRYWPVMGVEYEPKPLNIPALFGRNAPTALEIGFGMGASLVTMASKNPQQNFLGIEVHLPGVGACLASAHRTKLSNLRIIHHDAVEILQNMIPDSSLDIVQLFFPDPWQKARHNKRRIVQIPFVELVLQKLKINGLFHIATDWQPYAEHILKVITQIISYRNLSGENNYLPRPDTRPLTKFELRGKRLGHDVWDLMFARSK